MLVVDVSLSMRATDVAPTRLAALQSATESFARELPPHFELGLESFAGTTRVLVPPTTDRDTVVKAVQSISLAESTATGDALATALRTISTGRPRRTIVLVSDGKQTVQNMEPPAPVAPPVPRDACHRWVPCDLGTPPGPAGETGAIATPGHERDLENSPLGSYTIARQAAQGIPIMSVALGTPSGEITIYGQRIPVPSDEQAMREVATLSGGQEFTANSSDQLRDALHRISTTIASP